MPARGLITYDSVANCDIDESAVQNMLRECGCALCQDIAARRNTLRTAIMDSNRHTKKKKDVLALFEKHCKDFNLKFESFDSIASYSGRTQFCTSASQQYRGAFEIPPAGGMSLGIVQTCFRKEGINEMEQDPMEFPLFNMLSLLSFDQWSYRKAVYFWTTFIEDVLNIQIGRLIMDHDAATTRRWPAFFPGDIPNDYSSRVFENTAAGEAVGPGTKIFAKFTAPNGADREVQLGIINEIAGREFLDDNRERSFFSINSRFGLERLSQIANGIEVIPMDQRLIDIAAHIIKAGFIPDDNRQGQILREIFKALWRVGKTPKLKYFDKEAENFSKQREKFERLKNKYWQKSASWWKTYKGVSMDAFEEQEYLEWQLQKQQERKALGLNPKPNMPGSSRDSSVPNDINPYESYEYEALSSLGRINHPYDGPRSDSDFLSQNRNRSSGDQRRFVVSTFGEAMASSFASILRQNDNDVQTTIDYVPFYDISDRRITISTSMYIKVTDQCWMVYNVMDRTFRKVSQPDTTECAVIELTILDAPGGGYRIDFLVMDPDLFWPSEVNNTTPAPVMVNQYASFTAEDINNGIGVGAGEEWTTSTSWITDEETLNPTASQEETVRDEILNPFDPTDPMNQP